jgi:hypothetical protein
MLEIDRFIVVICLLLLKITCFTAEIISILEIIYFTAMINLFIVVITLFVVISHITCKFYLSLIHVLYFYCLGTLLKSYLTWKVSLLASNPLHFKSGNSLILPPLIHFVYPYLGGGITSHPRGLWTCLYLS